jgi:tripartite-type tricarboxylate transporter receptor subunit TctC
MLKQSLLSLALCAGLSQAAMAQAQWPNERVIKIVVASSAGGGTDTVARVLASELAKPIGQQFVVENRPGAGNVRGSDVVAKSAPDGYTLLMSASTLAINHVMYKQLPYDVARDFAPITQMVSLPNVLVVGMGTPFRTFGDFLSAARAKPGALTYGSAGLGTAPHMAMELLRVSAGIDVLHVPYTGVAPALNDIIGNRVDGMLVNFLSAKPQIDGGTLRALAMSSASRSRFMPDLPTINESGVPGYEAIQWFGLLAPAGTPQAIIDRLQAETAKILDTPAMKARLALEGAEPIGNSPAEFSALIKAEMAKWSQVAKAAGIKPE